MTDPVRSDLERRCRDAEEACRADPWSSTADHALHNAVVNLDAYDASMGGPPRPRWSGEALIVLAGVMIGGVALVAVIWSELVR